MARMRTIKPGFFTSEDVSVLPLRARLTWIGLWTHCDDEGRAKDNLKLIKAAIWPLDSVSLQDIEEDLRTLAVNERIVRYVVDGKPYLAVTNWRDHQHPQKSTASRLPPPPERPPPPVPESYRSPTVVLPEPDDSAPIGLPDGYRAEGRVVVEESRGGARTRPPPFCQEHPRGTTTPCGPCGVARRAHDAWQPPTPTPPPMSAQIHAMPPVDPGLAAAARAARSA